MASVEEITVDITARNMTLQQAAAILQSEFSKKADWYDTLVESINSTLQEENSEYLTKNLAVKIADRLIGEWYIADYIFQNYHV